MGRACAIVASRLCLGVLAVAWAAEASVLAQSQEGGSRYRPPVYQRRAFEWSPRHNSKRRDDKFGRATYWRSPQVNAGWFQRPYPYHLDYYRMRYGGSYAPYFGNLYGPPQVVTAPPYYGPYYGGDGYPANGYYGLPAQVPPQPGSQYEGDSLPAPQP